MEALRSRMLFALVALTLVPWSAALAQDPAEPQVTDPEGDALWYRTSDLAMSSGFIACGASGEVTTRACRNLPLAPPSAGGAPAPGLLDIIHTRLVDDGETVLVEMAVASLSNELVTLPFQADEAFGHVVCWSDGGDGCAAGVGFGVLRVNGSVQHDPYVWRTDKACAKIGICYFHVDVALVPGSPGFVRWSVPRLALPAEHTLLGAPVANTWHYVMSPGDLNPTYGARAQDARASGGAAATVGSTVDNAGPGADTPLLPPTTPWRVDLPWETTTPDREGDLPAARADLDILDLTLVETERTLTVALQVAEVGEIPLDHHFVAELYVTTGASVTGGYAASGGVRTPFSGVCEGGCAPNPRTPLAKPADIAVEPGAPGWVNITFSRADLGAPARGDTLAGIYVALLLPEAIVQRDVGDARVQQRSLFQGDFVWEQRPWWFSLGPEPVVESDDGAIIIEDPQGDVDLGLDATTLLADLGAFDIVSLRAEGSAPREVRIELGISDLSSVAPPTGYSAVFYAAAVSTERGAFMAGYYADDAKKQFFCAADTAVLTRPERDPSDSVWQAIDGLLSIARDRGSQAGGGSSPGSIVFLVPYSCFDEQGDGDLAVESFAGATFIMRAGAIQRVDDAQSEGPVTVLAAQVAPPPFWASPFGIDNFWDITGIVAAILIALFGAIALRRKQGALRRYLHEIEHVLKEHAGDARAREAALHGIQARLKDDLLRNRITESHFVIVERRLDQHLSKVRVQALADVFGDVPHRLLVTLQDLLRDGAMDREDWRLFRTQLAAEPHLTPETRAGIEQRVEAWVREHAAADA